MYESQMEMTGGASILSEWVKNVGVVVGVSVSVSVSVSVGVGGSTGTGGWQAHDMHNTLSMELWFRVRV